LNAYHNYGLVKFYTNNSRLFSFQKSVVNFYFFKLYVYYRWRSAHKQFVSMVEDLFGFCWKFIWKCEKKLAENSSSFYAL